ncbi:MAG: C10 family peptidase, partial [Muribaculaceae bacterium]|nr:C10 family peptidase [Muribaculaceae bacterium]
NVYGNIFREVNFSYSYVRSSIDKGYPVLAAATPGVINDNGHRFLIDGYLETTITKKYTYGYEYDPWTGEGKNPWEENEVDENGNIIYNTTREEYATYSSYSVYMNWGQDGRDDDVECGINSSWDFANISLPYNKSILKRSDVY